MNAGEIYYADLPSGRRRAIVVSREELNRGNYVVPVLCTTARYQQRAKLPNCVPFQAGEFGFTAACVAQCETVGFVEKSILDPQVLGVLDEGRKRDIVKALGYVFDAVCEPA